MTEEQFKILDKTAVKLELKYLPLSAKNNQEAREILAFTQFYRIHLKRVKELSRNENSGLHLQNVSVRVLSATEWIKKVHGKSHFEYLMDGEATPRHMLDIMQQYGDYVKEKLKHAR